MSTSQLDDEKLEALKEFRSRFSGLLQPRHDDRFLLRWLRARDFDVDAAEEMLREDFKMRKKIGSDDILETFRLKPEMKLYTTDHFLGFDNDGNCVHLFCATCDFKGFVRSLTVYEAIRYFVHLFEENHKRIEENNLKTGKNSERSTYIADMTGFRASVFLDKNVFRYALCILNYYQNHYPETLNAVYLVNVPSVFWYFFNVFKPFFNDVILRKIKIFENGDQSWKNELLNIIPKEYIPAYLGGDRYEPDAKCSSLINWDKVVPSWLYLEDMNTMKTSDPGVKQKLIRERSFFEIEKDIEKPNVILSWEFQTVDKNIKFGLFYEKRKYENSSRNNDREVLIPVESVDCNEFVEKGEYECKNLGTYILRFDNTYSWIRSKRLLYKVEVSNSTVSLTDDL